MLVMKFGGTSVTHPESVAAIKALVERELKYQPILVVSALSGITDLLVKLNDAHNYTQQQSVLEQIELKHERWINDIFSSNSSIILKVKQQIDEYLGVLKQMLTQEFEHPLQRHDSIVGFGEILSSFLISEYLNSNKLNTRQVLATKCIITNDDFGGADFIDEDTCESSRQNLLPLIEQGIVPVVTGFIGTNLAGKATVLGRGGSDYSAAILGYALNCREIQIWTDVNGVYSADPRVIKDAKLIWQLSYQEAAELAMFGAKVLHPRTIQPAVKAGIPVRVLNTFNIENKGTLIEHNAGNSDGLVKAITWKKIAPLLNIYSADMFLSKGFLQKIFAILAENNISVNMLSASEVSVSMTLDNTGKLNEALVELNTFAKADYIQGYGTISLVGEKIMSTPSLMQEIFNLLDDSQTRVEMLSYSASNINLSMVVAADKINEVVMLLHERFITRGISSIQNLESRIGIMADQV